MFKTVHLQHGGKLSLARVLAGHLDDGATLQSSSRRDRAGLRHPRGRAAPTTPSARRPRPARRWRSASSTPSRPATRCRAARPRRRRWSSVEPAPPVLAMALAAADRKDDVKLGQALLRAERGGSVADHGPQPADPRHRAVGAGRDASARRAGAAAATASASTSNRMRRRSAIRRPSASRSPSAAGTRSSPAATASSATWCWRSSRCRAAAASSSTRRWSAARCRETTSARWRRAWSTGWLRGPLGFPVIDVAGDADRRLLSQRRFLRSGVPHRGADRRQRSAAAMPAGAAGADPCGGDRLSDRRHREDQRHPVGPARPDSRLRHPRGLAGLGSASAP